LLGRLSRRGGPNVRFLGSVSRETIVDHLVRARSLILPGIEDFGITPLEAMAVGTPVVAFGEGGVLDSVAEGTTGIFFGSQTVESLSQALAAVESRSWDREAMRRHAAQFSKARFGQQFLESLARIGTSR
ncbi:MAG: glycosyltransferase, partial [Thermoanaerobaculia bacterium]